jgi:hypothetical protein
MPAKMPARHNPPRPPGVQLLSGRSFVPPDCGDDDEESDLVVFNGQTIVGDKNSRRHQQSGKKEGETDKEPAEADSEAEAEAEADELHHNCLRLLWYQKVQLLLGFANWIIWYMAWGQTHFKWTVPFLYWFYISLTGTIVCILHLIFLFLMKVPVYHKYFFTHPVRANIDISSFIFSVLCLFCFAMELQDYADLYYSYSVSDIELGWFARDGSQTAPTVQMAQAFTTWNQSRFALSIGMGAYALPFVFHQRIVDAHKRRQEEAGEGGEKDS